jgi:hypothetical protein
MTNGYNYTLEKAVRRYHLPFQTHSDYVFHRYLDRLVI